MNRPSDPALEGQILQFGFQNVAKNFESSGSFYDNVEVVLSAASGGVGSVGGDRGAGGTGSS